LLNKKQRSGLESIVDDQIIDLKSVSGGDINRAAFIRGKNGIYFIKYNSYPFGSEMLISEAHGLSILAASGQMVPEVIGHGNLDKDIYGLVLEWLEPSKLSSIQAESAGRELARQHKYSSNSFGFGRSNFLATFPQENEWTLSWPEFYADKRIRPLITACINKGYLEPGLSNASDRIKRHMVEDYPIERPSLVHGDLWSGNLHPSIDGNAYFIDPAPYFGYREVDIAMTRLFGGFPASFYRAYEEVFPLESGWNDRLEIYQLYYLLYHLFKFGRSYEGSVRKILKKLC
jgi:fructosamine-3-kinase